jgi:methionyl-tRNA formyltransferase
MTKIALFADKHVGLETLKYLLASFKNDLKLLVVTEQNDLSEYANQFGIPTEIYTENIHETIHKLSIDLGILAWWPKIIKTELINSTINGFINFHPSLLPHNRGKHYNFWAIVEECPFGVSIHRVEEGIDNGSILAQKEIPYDWEDNGETLFLKAQSCMLELFMDAYPKIRNNQLTPYNQDLSKGSFHKAHEIDSASKLTLDKTITTRLLLNLLRARTFSGHPSCWFESDEGSFEVRVLITRKHR